MEIKNISSFPFRKVAVTDSSNYCFVAKPASIQIHTEASFGGQSMTPRSIRERASVEGISAFSTPGTKVVPVYCGITKQSMMIETRHVKPVTNCDLTPIFE